MTASNDFEARLTAAAGLLQRGYPADAAAQLRALIAEAPSARAHQVLGAAMRQIGDFTAAMDAYAEALRLAPRLAAAAVNLNELLIVSDRAAEALAVIAPFSDAPGADHAALYAKAQALKSMRRYDAAIEAYTQATLAAPTSGVAEHNLAGALGDQQRFAESEAAARRALGKGLDAPETWLVHARALQGVGRLDEAELAFGQAINRRPNYMDAHNDLAQLVWMRTADAAAATAAVDAAIRLYPADVGLRVTKAKVISGIADAALAYAVLAETPTKPSPIVQVEVLAAQLAGEFDPPRALAHARRAYDLSPGDQSAIATYCQALLANGAPDQAARVAGELRQRWSLNQHAIALQATAWRMLGDRRADVLFDYDQFVRAYRIDAPGGWSSVDAYLADLGQALERRHPFRGHPLGQSLRHGSQTHEGLLHSDDPAIAAFFQAIDGPIRRHIAGLGHGADPLRKRITDGYAVAGAWSVRLRPGGFHINHVHPMGWISSACYIALPDAVGRGHEGWLKFGEPGVPTRPALEAQHFVKPEPGMLVLFPSYMWHGTVPFTGDQTRLSVAFDLLPA